MILFSVCAFLYIIGEIKKEKVAPGTNQGDYSMETNYEQRKKCKAEAIKRLCEQAHKYLEMAYKEKDSFRDNYINPFLLIIDQLTTDEKKEVNNIINGCDNVDYFVNTFYKFHQQEIDCSREIKAMILNEEKTHAEKKTRRAKTKTEKLEEVVEYHYSFQILGHLLAQNSCASWFECLMCRNSNMVGWKCPISSYMVRHDSEYHTGMVHGGLLQYRQ